MRSLITLRKRMIRYAPAIRRADAFSSSCCSRNSAFCIFKLWTLVYLLHAHWILIMARNRFNSWVSFWHCSRRFRCFALSILDQDWRRMIAWICLWCCFVFSSFFLWNKRLASTPLHRRWMTVDARGATASHCLSRCRFNLFLAILHLNVHCRRKVLISSSFFLRLNTRKYLRSRFPWIVRRWGLQLSFCRALL